MGNPGRSLYSSHTQSRARTELLLAGSPGRELACSRLAPLGLVLGALAPNWSTRAPNSNWRSRQGPPTRLLEAAPNRRPHSSGPGSPSVFVSGPKWRRAAAGARGACRRLNPRPRPSGARRGVEGARLGRGPSPAGVEQYLAAAPRVQGGAPCGLAAVAPLGAGGSESAWGRSSSRQRAPNCATLTGLVCGPAGSGATGGGSQGGTGDA